MNESYRSFFGLTREPFTSDIGCRDILVTPADQRCRDQNHPCAIRALTRRHWSRGDGKRQETALGSRWVSNPSRSGFLLFTCTSGSILELYKQITCGMDIDLTSNSKAVMTRRIKAEVLKWVVGKRIKIVLVIPYEWITVNYAILPEKRC